MILLQVELPLRLMGWLTDEWGSCYVNLQTYTPGWREGGAYGVGMVTSCSVCE